MLGTLSLAATHFPKVCRSAFALFHTRPLPACPRGMTQLGSRSLRCARYAVEAADTQAEAYQFQAEVSKVMDIIINSLYSNKDVFLRELVSNAADACDKKRFLLLTEREEQPEDMRMQIWADKERRTLTIEDNGIGMTKAELIENLGSIARSGTADFVKALGKGDADLSLIGQFGVGFYSAFLVADKVEVFSRSLNDLGSERKTWKWTSTSSDGTFSIEDGSAEQMFGEISGTKIVLHIKEDGEEYLESEKLSELLKRYSEFVTFPIELWTEKVHYDQAEGSASRSIFDWETVNKVSPIWLRSPEVVNQSEYSEFYKTTFKAFDEPLITTHFKAEGSIDFQALIFIPTVLPFELMRDMFSDDGRGIRLYVKRVFINDNFEDLIPRWLTFARGVVDSEDLPLNVGREILQKSRALQIIRKRVTRKVLDSIETLRQQEPEKFELLWNMYGKYFKVGLVEDFDYKDELKKLVRFFSSYSGSNMTNLAEYVSRMKEGQQQIYFVTGEGRRAAEISPAMEKMKQKGYEVLYMVDPLDEICGQSIVDFEGKELVDINKANFVLDKSEDEQQALESRQREFAAFTSWLQEELAERVQKVQISDRLVDSPAVLLQSEWGVSPMMQRYVNAQTASDMQGGASPMGVGNQAILEINAGSPVIQSLKASMEAAPQAESTRDMVMMIYETAALSGGYAIEDPGEFAKRVTKLMEMNFASGSGDGSAEKGERHGDPGPS